MTALANLPSRASGELEGNSWSFDILSALTIYAVIRVALPSQYVIGALGGAGQPAELIGLGIALWWLASWLGRPWPASRVRQPLKRYALAFFVAVLVSYLAAAVRPISSSEQLAADRALLNVIAWTGVMLVVMDGLTSRAKLDTLLRRLTLLGGLEGVLGLVQLLAGQTFLQYLQLPGLSNTGVDPALVARGSFDRPQGTAIHPIEYGVILAMLLPIALHYAVADAGRRRLFARWFPVVAMALAVSLSITRTAIICTAVGLVLLLVSWPSRLRRSVYLAAPVLLAALTFVIPGFFRTVLDLFTGIQNDPSTRSRTDSYSLAWSFIARAPLFGRGMGTFLPEYRILDNQLLGSLIEIGVFGVVCMLLLFAVAGITAWRVPTPVAAAGDGALAMSRLGPALAAAIAAGIVSFATFDAWSFPLVPSMLFLMFGCAGALWRLTLDDALTNPGGVPAAAAFPASSNQRSRRQASGITVWSLASAVRRRWPFAAAGILITLAGSYAAAKAPGVYYEDAAVVFVAPKVVHSPQSGGLEAMSSSLVSVAGLVSAQLNEQGPLALSPAATIASSSLRSGVWVRLPNEGGQWATNFDQNELDVEVISGTPQDAQAEMLATVVKVRSVLRQDQLAAGAPPGHLISVGMSPPAPPVLYMRGSRSRAGFTALALGMILTLTLVVMIDRRAGRRVPGAAMSDWLSRRWQNLRPQPGSRSAAGGDVDFGSVERTAGDSSARRASRGAGRRQRSN